MTAHSSNADPSPIRHIPLSHNNADSQASALRLILTLFPDWETAEGPVEFTRFTDGITNTLLKAVKRRPGWTEEQIDNDAVLLRAYGKGTEVLIDRERETTSHSLLSRHHLAPTLLARFQNGLMYRFIQGRVCTSTDLTRESVWRGVARRLGEWHAVLPIVAAPPALETDEAQEDEALSMAPSKKMPSVAEINAITPGKVTPSVWTVMQKWIFALPIGSEAEIKRKAVLQAELERIVRELGDTPGRGKDGLVFSHCDLLSGNVIIQPRTPETLSSPIETVSFIDYEYATPSPAAFDLANHFAEWGGFECDYSMLPTRSVRREFLREYLESYNSHVSSSSSSTPVNISLSESEVTNLFTEVDAFRGIPGFYWGIWALIQATISQIDFDYAAYAEIRLGEYWAWREEREGTRVGEIGERERRWSEE